jgi:hypothetical protein
MAGTSPAMTMVCGDAEGANVASACEGWQPGQTLPLLLPQPQARRVAIGELDAGLFQHALDRREIVLGRVAPAFLEIDDDVFGNRGPGSQFGFIAPKDKPPAPQKRSTPGLQAVQTPRLGICPTERIVHAAAVDLLAWRTSQQNVESHEVPKR